MNYKRKIVYCFAILLFCNIIFANITFNSYAIEDNLVEVAEFKNSQELNDKIEEAKKYGVTIKVCITDDLKGYSIERVTDEYYHSYLDEDFNVLILFSTTDRKIRVHTGENVRALMPDYLTEKMVNSIVPYFREEKYDEGLQIAIETYLEEARIPNKIAESNQEAIQELNKYLEVKKEVEQKFVWGFIIICIIIVLAPIIIPIIINLIEDIHYKICFKKNKEIDEYNKGILERNQPKTIITIPKKPSKNEYVIKKPQEIKLLEKEDSLGRKPIYKPELFKYKGLIFAHSYVYLNDLPLTAKQAKELIEYKNYISNHNYYVNRINSSKNRYSDSDNYSNYNHDNTYVDISSSFDSSSCDCGGSSGSW